MDYHKLSLIDLKHIARDHNPPIKHYYIKSRIELIRILSLKEFPQSFILQKKTIAELRKEALEKGHKNIWKFKKAQLVELLYPSSQEDDQNDNHAKEHNNPKHGEGE
jgi:hypothetical protein